MAHDDWKDELRFICIIYNKYYTRMKKLDQVQIFSAEIQMIYSHPTLSDVAEQTRSTVASISESVCRPLKTRIEQMIVTDQGREGGKKPVQLYKISNLLRFYHNTIKQVCFSLVFFYIFFIHVPVITKYMVVLFLTLFCRKYIHILCIFHNNDCFVSSIVIFLLNIFSLDRLGNFLCLL